MYIQEALRRYSYSSSDSQQYRYWSPTAQKYASGDQLARFLQEGWRPSKEVIVEHFWVGEARQITVFHLNLKWNDREVMMGVLANPFVRDLLSDARFGFRMITFQKGEANVGLVTRK